MATGYIRNDTANNIANGNTINASDLDGEFDAIQAAMDATTGHTHDGTVGGGAPIVGIGPVQDVVITTSALRPKTDNTVDLGTSSLEFKDLYLDGTANIDTLQVDESATIAANLTVSGNATITTNLTVNGNTVIGNANNDTLDVKADFISSLVPNTDDTYDLGFTTNEWRDLYIDGIANIDTLQVDESATITANLTVNGNTTLGDSAADTVTITADVASNLIPSVDNTHDLGSATDEWRNIYIDGTAQVDTLQVDESATITADLTVNGNTTLGNAATDTVTVTADVASNLIPSADNTYDLGATGSEWKDLYVTGTANIDSLVADTAAISAGTATLSAATIITAGGGTLTLQRNTGAVETGETLGEVDFQAPNEVSGGDAILVSARIKAVARDTFSSTVNKTSLLFQTAAAGGVVTRVEIAENDTTVRGNVLPDADNTYDLGATGSEWKDLWIDGTANIDSLVADTADINGGTIDGAAINGTTIGATTAAAGTFTSVTAPSVTITGGTINGTTIGATTAAAGTFTSVTAPSVTITGGTINGTSIGATTASTIAGTTGTFSGDLTIADKIVHSGDTNTTIRFPDADTVTVETAGDERMRITSAGNVGIGTTAPVSPLHVYLTDATTYGDGTGALDTTNLIRVQNDSEVNDTYSGIQLVSENAAGTQGWWEIASLSTSSNYDNHLVFHTRTGASTYAERMRIDNTGSLILAGSTAQKATGTTWSNPSDQRLKSNITNYPKGIPELMQVRVCEWEYNGKGGTVEGMKGIGVIADEVMTVLPNTVETYDAKLDAEDEETTAIKKFDATEITWLLVKAVQEQQVLINSLEARLSALEAQ
jgi:hypothetical protein